ncbi:MAG: DUF2490 domain-containing protein [Hyphomonas sp.]|jgi:long-subunit fatty acid transport protein
MKRTCLALIALSGTLVPSALAENQTWTGIELKTRPAPDSRWEYVLYGELRFQPDADLAAFNIRPGISYKVDDDLKLSGGYRYGVTRRSGPDQKEHRLWQNASYTLLNLREAELLARTQLEQNWREGADGTAWRLRQRISLKHPVPGTELEFDLSSESFFALNDTSWMSSGFREHRLRLDLKGEMENGVGWSAGYMNQFREGNGTAPDLTNHQIVIGLSASF